MDLNDELLVPERGSWAPRVVRRDGHLLLTMMVASGHMDRSVALPVAERHVPVLRDDATRYWLLHAALHSPYQLRDTELDADELATYLDTILLAPADEVEEFLTALDHGRANGAISNIVSIFTHADRLAMRDGRWFEALDAAAG
ncbi:DUF6357 family protein [uncultured Nocardioides sp.]|uniref:DUF6357 family protein n=1 Tax=uncultured Nocardioides sp. TaxID=198441 RepID=UPI0026025036|nr:DUF6357 family protein [uncultured Nocardioides sp.]